VVIGISDSGVDGSHPALAASFRGGDDSWYDPWNGSPAPVDQFGHGTHAIGSALGAGGIGVAPGARLAVGLVLDGQKGGSDAQALAGIDWALERSTAVG